jgi:protein TonB
MKKILSALLPMSLFALLITGCNNGENKASTGTPNATVATDSSMMTTTTTADSTNTTSATVNNISKDTAQMAKPNPDKKGKKGMVSIAMNDKKETGDMDAIDKEGYYTNVYPAYPGGDKALESFFEKNIAYPSAASDNGVEGTVKISFTVDETGKISSPKVTSPTMGYGLEEEALRVFKKMPSWKPGSLKGKNVKTRFNLPVRFQLES